MKSQPAPDARNINGGRITRSGTSAMVIRGPSPPKKEVQRTAPAKAKKGKGKRGPGKFKMAYTNRKATRILSESGNNELSKDELSYLTDEEKLLLSSWGLPRSVLDKYRAKGITSLFPWQLDCLANEKVLEGCNLLYSAPTSAGKTMVAEILMIKRVLELGKKAMMILPFVSVSREKMYSLQELFGDAGVRVEGFMGNHNPPGGFQQVDIAICTIERANSLINRMLEEGTLSQLGTIVVDELHLIGDPNRGYLLELLLTKIRYMTSQRSPTSFTANGTNTNEENANSDVENNSSSPAASKPQIQIVGMSATLPNLDLLATWLQAELVISDYRPVPLVERILIGDSFYDRDLNLIRPVATDMIPFQIANDPDNIVYLCLETVLGGHSILVFCPTKAMCESVAQQISRAFYQIGHNYTVTSTPEVSLALREQLDGSRLKDVLKQLEQCPAGKDDNLYQAVCFAVAFHHAGLTFDERDIVESAFKRGIVRVIVATSTLSAGVNLPARRVLIKPPDYGNNLDVLTYHQMSGRAGRKGVDTEGESVLICNGATRQKSVNLIQSALQPVSSALLGDRGELTSSMKRALLEVIASGVASTPAQVNTYAQSTLLSLTIEIGLQFYERTPTPSQEAAHLSIVECLQFLEKNDFIRLKVYETEGRENEYMPTQLGSACLASSLPPDEGIIVFKELEKARRCFVLENELHIIYQVTPIYVADQWGTSLDWHQYFKLWENLSPDQQKVGELVGVQEGFIIKAWQGMVSSKSPKQFEMFTVHTRFYTALALSDLVNEMPIGAVCDKYNVNKGVVQNLQQAAATFAGQVTAFCNRLGWSNLELLLSQFQDRLEFGVQRELVDLVRLPLLNGQRARILYDAGIKCISALAISEPAQIEHILHKASSFSSAVHGGQQAKSIWVLGKKEGMSETQAASMIVADAREFLKIELGLPDNIQFTKLKTLETGHEEGIHEDVEDNGQGDNRADSEKENIVLSFSQNKDSEVRDSSRAMDVDSSSISALRLSTSDTHGRRNNPGYSIFDITNSDDAFDDTFPSIDDRDLQAAQGESERIPASNSVEAENSVNIQRMLDRSGRHNNSSIITNGMNGNPSTEIPNPSDSPLIMNGKVLKASTPVTAQPQVEIEDDFDFEREFLESKFETSNVTEEPNDVMMESMTSFMEVSLIISDDGKSPTKKRNSEPYKLSESILAAAVAMAGDSDGSFSNDVVGSKSIFDDSPGDSSDEDIQLSPLELPSPCVVKTPTVNLSTNEAGDEVRSFCDPKSKQVFKSVQFQGRMIQVRTVEAPQFIPHQFFTGPSPIGVGVLLCSPQRSNSMSKAGIGSKILRKSGAVTPVTARTPEVEKDHAVALFTDTSDTIWVFQWRSESARGRHFLSNQSKVAELFQRIKDSGKAMIMLDAKEKLKRLLKYCGEHLTLNHFPVENQIWDPKIAEWLLNFDEEHHISLETLLQAYFEDESGPSKRIGWSQEILESFWAVKLMAVLKGKLTGSQLWEHFTEIEMPSIRPLMLMEINGFGLNSVELDRLKKVLDSKAALLELRAYQLAGRQFNLSSPKDIRQILFREIGLTQPPRTRGTGKDVLSRIDHEFPKVIMEWRKVTSALTKVLIPFQQDRNLGTGRVHGVYSHFTVTGRVNLSEPSLQCIPRDFDLQLSYTAAQVEEIRHNCRIKFGDKLVSLFFKLENGLKDGAGELAKSVSMRNAFVPCSEQFTLVSADYCQLELRILAHLCEDANLRRALNRPGDVFKTMASQWKNIPESKVTDEIRQDTKAVTYGIIYGMGPKTLSEHMEIDEMEASSLITQFMRTYPGIRSFIDKTVKFCKEHGYIETMSGRRRFLGHINSRSPGERAQAERQAINSRIQGSASDLVKTAMTKIQARLSFLYPASMHPVDWKVSKNSSQPLAKHGVESVYFPILNLHDELIYEVRKKDVPDIAREIKVQMESSLRLKVSLPVVLKSGQTWSSLKPYVFPTFGRQNY